MVTFSLNWWQILLLAILVGFLFGFARAFAYDIASRLAARRRGKPQVAVYQPTQLHDSIGKERDGP